MVAPAVSIVPPTTIPEITPPIATLPPPKRPPARVGKMARWFGALTSVQRTNVKAVCQLRSENPCAGLIPMPTRGGVQEVDQAKVDIDEHLASLTVEQRAGVTAYCDATTKHQACSTPLVVAFAGEPIELAASAGTFAFVPGQPVTSDWPTATTPWIALDRDGNGRIDSGAELFGDATGAANGFVALAELDANHDGRLDRDDPAFASLLLWADRNHDRHSTPDELTPLADRVLSIPLANHRDTRCNARGDCEGERGLAMLRGGATGAVVDVYLVTQ